MNIKANKPTKEHKISQLLRLNSTPFLVKHVESALIVSVVNNGFTYVATQDRSMWRLEKFWPDGRKIPTVETFDSIEKLANASPQFYVLPLLLKLGCYKKKTSVE